MVFVLSVATTNGDALAKAKKVKLDKTKITLNCGDTKTVTLKNVRKKVSWKVSNKSRISIIKKNGKYKNKIKLKAKKTGSTVLTAVYKKKKYKCRITIKTSSDSAKQKNNNNPELLEGVFQYDQYYEWPNSKCVSIKKNNSKIYIKLPRNAKDINFNGNCFKYTYYKDYFNASIEYKIVDNINNVADCERKVIGIVKNIPNTLGEDYVENPHKGIDVLGEIKDAIKGIEDDDYGDKRPFFEKYNLDSVWYTQLSNSGYSYFWEESKRDPENFLIYKTMIEDSYNYIAGMCLELKVEVNKFNYLDLFNSYDTETERNLLSNDYDSTFGWGSYFVDDINSCAYTDGRMKARESSWLTFSNGFKKCLDKQTKLIK